jgi:hypothetical protein
VSVRAREVEDTLVGQFYYSSVISRRDFTEARRRHRGSKWASQGTRSAIHVLQVRRLAGNHLMYTHRIEILETETIPGPRSLSSVDVSNCGGHGSSEVQCHVSDNVMRRCTAV